MKNILLLLLLLSSGSQLFAQDIGLSSFFRPGARVSALYLPEKDLGNGETLEMSQLRTSLIIPVGGKASFSLKDLEAKASQHFINVSAGFRQANWNVLPSESQIANFSVGFTGISGKLGSGIWFYTGQAGFLQDLDVNTEASPFAVLAAMKIKIKGLNKQNFYGLGVAYNGKRFLPIPLIGLRRKIADKTHITAIFPVQLDVTTKLSSKTQLSFLNTVNGFANQTEVAPNQERLMTFGGLRNSLILKYKISKGFSLWLEGGVFSFAQLQLFDTDRDQKFTQSEANFTPFASVTARINFGKALIGSQLFGNDF